MCGQFVVLPVRQSERVMTVSLSWSPDYRSSKSVRHNMYMYLTASSPNSRQSHTLSPHIAVAYSQLLSHGQIDLLVGSGADNDKRLSAGQQATCRVFQSSLPHCAASSGTEQHWREIRGVRPQQKDWAKANQACCRRISTRWSTRNGLA